MSEGRGSLAGSEQAAPRLHFNSGHVIEQKKKNIRFAFTKSADGQQPWPMRTGVPPRIGGIKDEPDLVCSSIINEVAGASIWKSL